MTISDELQARLREAVEQVKAMTPEEYAAMVEEQRQSYVRGLALWPAPKYHFENGAKIYDSYEDYCND